MGKQRSVNSFIKTVRPRFRIDAPLLYMSTAQREDTTPEESVIIFDSDMKVFFYGNGTTTGGVMMGGSEEEVRTIDSAAASTATVDAKFINVTATTATANSYTCTAHGLQVGDTIVALAAEGTLINDGLVANTVYTIATRADDNTFTLTGVTFSGNGTTRITFRVVTKTITSATQTESTENFGAADHGLAVGDVITCTSQSSTGNFGLHTANLVEYIVYTVDNVNTFELSDMAGTQITFDSDGTETIVFAYTATTDLVDKTGYVNYFTWAKGADLRTGDAVTIGGTAPYTDVGETALSGTYYIVKNDTAPRGDLERNADTRFRLSDSRVNALAGSDILPVFSAGSSVTFVALDVWMQGYEQVTYITPGVAHDYYLPDATANTNKSFVIKKTSAAYAVTVKSVAGTVDGANAATGIALESSSAQFVEFISDGTNWIKLASTSGAVTALTGDVDATAAAVDWDLIDNNSSALSIDVNKTGPLGLLNFDTRNDQEIVSMTLPAGAKFSIDAGTTRHTAATVMDINCDVNSADCDALRINLDVDVALSGTEKARGIFVDVNGITANVDGTAIVAYDTLITATTDDRADLTGYQVVFDGTHSTADSIYGFKADLSSITDTDYTTDEFNGLDIDMPAAYQGTDIASAIKATGAGSVLRVLSGGSTQNVLDIDTAAGVGAITIDSATADRTIGDVIYADVDVNAAAVNAIHIDFDVGTALSIDTCRAIFLDIDGITASTNGSALIGVDILLTAVNADRSDVAGFKVSFDGSQNSADTTYGLYVNDDQTHATNAFCGVLVEDAGATHTSGTWYGVSVASSAVVTSGTLAAGSFLVNVGSIANAGYGVIIGKDTDCTGTPAGDSAVTNSALYVTCDMTNDNTGGKDITSTGDVVAVSYTSDNDAGTSATADTITGNALKITTSADVKDAAESIMAAAQSAISIDYDLIQAGAGALNVASLSIIDIDYDTTGAPAFASGTYNMINVDCDDADTPAVAATGTFNGLQIDTSGLKVTDADLTLSGIKLVMPATYGNATEYAMYATGDGMVAQILSDGVGATVTADATASNAYVGLAVSKNTAISGTAGGDATVTNYIARFAMDNTNACTDNKDVKCGVNAVEIDYTNTNSSAAGTTDDTLTGNALDITVTGAVGNNAASIMGSMAAGGIFVDYNITEAASGEITCAAFSVLDIDFDTAETPTYGAGDYNLIKLNAADASTPVWGTCTFQGIGIDLSAMDTSDSSLTLSGAKITMPSETDGSTQYGAQLICTSAVNIDNNITGIHLTKDCSLSAAGTATISPANYMLYLTSTATNADDDAGHDIDNTIGGAYIKLYHNDNIQSAAQTDKDTFAGKAVYIDVDGDVNDADAKLYTTAQALDIDYTVGRTVAGLSNIESVDIVDINLDVAAGVAVGTAAGVDLNVIKVDGDGFVPGATFANTTSVRGMLVDFSAANLNDAQATFIGLGITMPTELDNVTAAAMYGISIDATTAIELGNELMPLLVTKNASLSIAAAGNIATANYMAKFTSTATNNDDGGFDIANAGNGVEIELTHLESATVTQTDSSFSGTALDIEIVASTENNQFNGLTTTARAIDILYDVNYDTAGEHYLDATDIFRIDFDVAASTTLDNAGTINMMLLDANGFIPATTNISANFDINALKIDMTSVSCNDANVSLSGIELIMPSATHALCADLDGIKVTSVYGNALHVVGWAKQKYVDQYTYYWCEDFNEEAATVNLETGLRGDEWTSAGNNDSADDATYEAGAGGVLQIQTDGANDDSVNLTHDIPAINTGNNPIFECRFKVDTVSGAANNMVCALVGLTEVGGFVDKLDIEATTDDFILVGIDTDNVHTFGSDQIVLFTDDNGAAAQTGLPEDMGVAATANTYVTVRIDCTDTEQPRIFVNNTGGAIAPTNEVISTINATIKDNIVMYPVLHCQALDGNARTMTVDYIKVWQDRG